MAKDEKVGSAHGEDNGEKATGGTPPWPLATISVFGVIVLLAIFVVGWWMVAGFVRDIQDEPTHDVRGQQRQWDSERFDRHGHSPLFRYGERVAQGVVTAIDGDVITVSGSGKQVTVKKTSNTVVSGDKNDISINDTVVVFGDTEEDGSVVAKRIVVQNESSIEDIDSVENDWTTVPSA